MAISTEEEVASTNEQWKMNFDGALNALGHGIGVILVSHSGKNYPFTNRLKFDCTNNMAEYEACILGLRDAIECKVEKLKVYRDSALVIYQLREFENVTFHYLPREDNQMADALATLVAAFKVNEHSSMIPITMQAYGYPAHCYSIEEEEDLNPWYYDILQ
ncbi:uncharacterized protein LOC120182493 [Hibiscus syriacus]|uniref:uncharacterized protein LOC120182493 n=1 Tax=Hibiscus syriacus TaxID=106335 RepID=UPI0019232188|nr:uncharacterized protein LOC120182493 [Hibiscus syriacus]